MFDYVSYGDLVLDGTPDALGVIWCVTDLEGWWDTPPLEQVLEQPTGLDEGVVSASTLDARPLVLRGTADHSRCRDRLAVVATRDRLASLTWPLLAQKPLTVSEEGVVRQTSVLPAGEQRVSHAGRGALLFEVPLVAQDPRKYGADVKMATLPGTVVNAGNVTTYPVITLAAGGTVSLANSTLGSGAVLTISGAAPGTVIDMRRRTATALGVDQYSKVRPNSVWWHLVPGPNVITVSSGTADIAWRDAWL